MSDAISTLDRRFGEWVATHFSGDMAQRDRTTLQRLAEAVSLAVSLKHTCLDCDVYPHLGEPLFASLLKGIKAADVQRVVTPDVKPLVASSDGRHIWLHKYHVFERAVAALLTVMQQEKRLEIITGGPGTGKTWTAAERIKRELAANPHCVIQLAAPTGKAANNMMVALTRAGFDGSAYPVKGLTLHALLGMNGRSPKPRHNRQHPLICDVLIVDEASMIDLPMMYRLLLAIPPTATLLLLGDQDQLASVEAGSVLADICRAFADSGCIKRLTDSHRSKNSPEISVLANALNKGTLPDMQSNQSVHCHILAAGDTRQPDWLDQAVAGYGWIGRAVQLGISAEEILGQQTQFQLLCALREGPFGVTGINRLLAEALGKKPDSWYIGQPVMVTQNDHDRKLYNGDIGMVLEQDGMAKACFIVGGELKAISRAQMPTYETCYAMTVHKSQGSEYDHVMIVLPSDVSVVESNPVITRELVYTAVTRARTNVDIWCGEGVLQVAANRQATRMSGLGACLSG